MCFLLIYTKTNMVKISNTEHLCLLIYLEFPVWLGHGVMVGVWESRADKRFSELDTLICCQLRCRCVCVCPTYLTQAMWESWKPGNVVQHVNTWSIPIIKSVIISYVTIFLPNTVIGQKNMDTLYLYSTLFFSVRYAIAVPILIRCRDDELSLLGG